MMSATDEFEAVLQEEIESRSVEGTPKRSILVTMFPLLLQLLVTAADNCKLLGSNNATIAQEVSNPGPITKSRMRRMMIRDLYDGSLKRYREEDGQDLLDSTFAAASRMKARMVDVMNELGAAPNPAADWNMG